MSQNRFTDYDNTIVELKIISLTDKIGKSIGILENYLHFYIIEIIGNKIICNRKKETKENFGINLIDSYNYIKKLSELYYSQKYSFLDVLADISRNIGIPKRYLIKEKNYYYVDTNYIKNCQKYFELISEIILNKKDYDVINNYSKAFPVYLKGFKNYTYITDKKLIVCSQNFFGLVFFTCSILCMSNYNLKNPFICDECGFAFEKLVNNQKYCKNCRPKVNFSKMSRN